MATRRGARLDTDVGLLGDTVKMCAGDVTNLHGRAPREIAGLAAEMEQPRIIAGKYRLERPLGEGGMGTIWQAFNLQLELAVAVKLMHPGLRSVELVERFRSEARMAARLVHPSIVRVFDVGESEAGEPFIVMELLKGESLAQVLERGRLSPVAVVRLLLPIAEALSLTHSSGVVHRDLKPDNVFVVTNGHSALPKLLDFGIAKTEDVESGCRRKLTHAGALLGSPDYMSPEQIAGRSDVDHRSDIWSFCVMLHEALSGKIPFSGQTLRELRRCVSEDNPPILEQMGIDPSLARIVRRGLEKDRRRRPVSIAELGRALAGWLVEQGVWEDAAGSSVSAKWLEVGYVPPPCAESRTATPATSAPGDAVTVVSEDDLQPNLRRRWHWPAVLGAVTGAALVTLGMGFAAGASASRPPLVAPIARLASIADSEQKCRTPAATPLLAPAPGESRTELLSFSTERGAPKLRTLATTSQATGAMPPKPMKPTSKPALRTPF